MCGKTARILLTHKMGTFLDKLSGKFFGFRTAMANDINSGASDKLIITPLSLVKSDALTNVIMPIIFPAVVTNRTSAWTNLPHTVILPDNAAFFKQRSGIVQAQLSVIGNVDAAGIVGEIALQDTLSGSLVISSVTQVNTTANTIKNSPIFNLQTGKAYHIVIRRTNGSGNLNVNLRAASISIKFLANP